MNIDRSFFIDHNFDLELIVDHSDFVFNNLDNLDLTDNLNVAANTDCFDKHYLRNNKIETEDYLKIIDKY